MQTIICGTGTIKTITEEITITIQIITINLFKERGIEDGRQNFNHFNYYYSGDLFKENHENRNSKFDYFWSIRNNRESKSTIIIYKGLEQTETLILK